MDGLAEEGRLVGNGPVVAVLGKVVDRRDEGDRVGEGQKAEIDGEGHLGELLARKSEKGEHISDDAEYEDERIEPDEYGDDKLFHFFVVHFKIANC